MADEKYKSLDDLVAEAVDGIPLAAYVALADNLTTDLDIFSEDQKKEYKVSPVLFKATLDELRALFKTFETDTGKDYGEMLTDQEYNIRLELLP